ncbi:Hypothetical_protein [Hexamita inflata]|uniref:Hypothetical_protein n=1 Tax=Hexamita inflata TaxID=28002 RepID=A0AA86Q1M4_9EUKA|nr:Hypothetical protein HINF_LOCUS36626 [Hexamita inflata]
MSLIYTEEYELQFQCQQQLYTFKTYEVASATNVIQSTDFASGFVFSTQVIQNAFIDIQSIGSTFTLFQTQNWFLNLKIQLDNITFGTGAMITPGQQLRINQMSIIQKAGTQISVNSGAVLSILQQSTSESNITNLLLNLNMNIASVGMFSIINDVRGTLNIKGYEIHGNYFSKNTIVLGVFQIQINSAVQIQYVSITPKQFQCGNLSSYLISYIDTSSASFRNIQIININNLNEYNVISDLQTNEAYFVSFGGLVTVQNKTACTVINIKIDLNDMWETNNVNIAGYLFGQFNSSNIKVINVCAYIQLTSHNSATFYLFGVIGYGNGVIEMSNAAIIYNQTNGTQNIAGVAGCINGTSAHFINVDLRFQISINNSGNYMGALTCMLTSDIWQVVNMSVFNSSVSAKVLTGLIASYASAGFLLNLNIQSSALNSSGVYQNTYALSGSIIGDSTGKSANIFTVIQCVVSNISVFAFSSGQWTISGGLMGNTHDSDVLIQQTILTVSNISTLSSASDSVSSGGIIAWAQQAKIVLNSVQVENVKLQAENTNFGAYCGGFLAGIGNLTVQIKDSSISSLKVFVSWPKIFWGMALSNRDADVYDVVNVRSEGINTLNGVIVDNCANIVNQEDKGC